MSDRNGMRRPMKQGNELYVDERGTTEMKNSVSERRRASGQAARNSVAAKRRKDVMRPGREIEFNSTRNVLFGRLRTERAGR